jgi:hypothetical protein
MTHLIESRGVSGVTSTSASIFVTRLTPHMYDTVPDMELDFFLTLDALLVNELQISLTPLQLPLTDSPFDQSI